MSTRYLIMIIAGFSIAASSCKSKEQKDAEKYMSMIQETVDKNSPKQTSNESSAGAGTAVPEGMEDIVGEWELISSIVDTNDNMEIDEEERPKLKSVSYKDYMKLNKDGSGLFTVAQMEGRYEITDDGSRGKKRITWYDKAGGPHKIGTIIKVTKEELHIKEPGGWGLFLWKRM